LVYNYINNHYNNYTINHDILGFIDKEVEKLYAYGKNNALNTIANIDIYETNGE
jgi:hypothetical protein